MRNAREGGREGGKEGGRTELGADVGRGDLLLLEVRAVEEGLHVCINGRANSVRRQQVIHAAAEWKRRKGGREGEKEGGVRLQGTKKRESARLLQLGAAMISSHPSFPPSLHLYLMVKTGTGWYPPVRGAALPAAAIGFHMPYTMASEEETVWSRDMARTRASPGL